MMMKRAYKSCSVIVILILIFSLCACSSGKQNEPSASPTQTGTPSVPSTASQQPDNSAEPYAPEAVSGEVIVTFDYEKQSGSASNQYSVWIEDMDGNYINTLYATE
jgi:ABC-type uncharacterized transport system auxiliary subunit